MNVKYFFAKKKEKQEKKVLLTVKYGTWVNLKQSEYNVKFKFPHFICIIIYIKECRLQCVKKVEK